MSTMGAIGGPFTPTKNPAYVPYRIDVFEELFAAHQKTMESVPEESITVELPDGKTQTVIRGKTTPLEIAAAISVGLANNSVVAQVMPEDGAEEDKVVDADGDDESDDEGCCQSKSNWILWDMTRPLESSCKLRLLNFEEPEARNVFWHSSAHVMGQALEMEFGGHLTIGPALERGFYYDMYMGDTAVTQEAYAAVEAHVSRIQKEAQPFQRLVITKQDALRLFKDNPFKLQLISSKVPDGAMTSVYRCGPFVDLCRGPHIANTKQVKAFMVEKHSSAYWLGKADNDSLQRVYAISFPQAKLLKEHKKLLEEAKKRDHRMLGNSLDLFFFETNFSAGSCFWLPEGTKIFRTLCEFIRNEYRVRGFTEVISPNIYSADLFKVSGHYQNYYDSMYMFNVEGKEWGLKPMNCPGHCLMFKHMHPTYKQLPIRMAEFGVLHRNELTGSLTGLTRVRRFQQDDAHIFCGMKQVAAEVLAALQFLFFVYDKFNFQFEVKLSTRPKKALGSPELWAEAEAQLEDALNQSGLDWSVNPGDGAFYGPKIDIRIKDALQRFHQCGTIQLDFQLPLRFNLMFRTQDVADKKEAKQLKEPYEVKDPKQVKVAKDEANMTREESLAYCSLETDLKPGHARPVIIHRAILGSVERMTAVLVEHLGGKFPVWLSPRQVRVLPVADRHSTYANYVFKQLNNFGWHCDIDLSNNTIAKKVREAQLAQWNYILVVGDQEQESQTVTVRRRDDPKNQDQMSLRAFLDSMEENRLPNSVKPNMFEEFKL